MLNFTITNNPNSFSIKVGNNTSPFSRNGLRVSFSSDNDQILNIYDKSVNNTLLWSINVSDDVVDVGGVTVFADAQALFNEIEAIFFLDDTGGGGESSVVINPTPPTNTSKLWFNTSDSLIYFYDGTNWLSSQLYETTFIDQGSTPNNTFFRVGNTVTGETGIGFNLEFSAQIEGLSFNRQPSSASIGNFWLYSNSGLPNPDQAVVVVTFTSTTDARGYINSPTYTALDEGSYIAVRWNGTQTNNNIVSLKYRKKYI